MSEPRFFAGAAQWRRWLAKHHDREPALVVGFHKKGSGRGGLTYSDALDDALCYGWIDGVRRNLDEHSYSIRFSPRKTSSIWSAVNLERVRVLTEQGRMMPSGLRAFAARKPDKQRIYSYERAQAVELDPAYAKQLARNKAAATFFRAQAPWYQRTSAHWIMSAKKEETRQRRLAILIECSAASRPIPPLAYGPKAGRK